MQAFHNDSSVKERYLSRVRVHAAADEIIRGRYWENGKGCAVGCTIHGDSHQAYEDELGIPRAIARLEDRIFEGMTNEVAIKFPAAFLEAVNIGADLSLVLPKFYVRIFSDPEKGTILKARPDGVVAIQRVIDLFGELIAGNKVTRDSWVEARRNAAARRKHYDWMGEVLLEILRESK